MIRIEPVGAEALLLVLADEPDARLPLRIAQLAESIRQRLGSQLRDLVPGWTTLLLHYDLLRIDPTQLAADLEPLLQQWQRDVVPVRDGRMHEMPVWYGGEDLASVARACGLSTAEVIELHSATLYRVGAIGFAPGFAYLGELDTRLALPRRSSPRTRVPAGSLAIAERQTAIYPQASPAAGTCWASAPTAVRSGERAPCPLALGTACASCPSTNPPIAASGRAMNGLRLLKAGPLSLLQDCGRQGWQHLGVSPAGPMDRHAAAWANRLLGNAAGTPLIEIALGGVELESLGDNWVALCGADLPITLDGEVRPNWSRRAARRATVEAGVRPQRPAGLPRHRRWLPCRAGAGQRRLPGA